MFDSMFDSFDTQFIMFDSFERQFRWRLWLLSFIVFATVVRVSFNWFVYTIL